MATEDFTTYTEVDSAGVLTILASKITAIDCANEINTYVYKDFGADYFNALNVDFEIYHGSASMDRGLAGGPAFANVIGDFNSFGSGAVGVNTSLLIGITKIYLRRPGTSDSYTIAADTIYYCTLKRLPGSNTITLEIYSDAARTNLLDTLSRSGFGTTKWRYCYGFVNDSAGQAGRNWDGYVQNLELLPTVPTVTIQAITNIVTTTAKGHGTLTAFGGASVTEHGHCWSTSSSPTTADSKTELGVKYALTTFVSEITGLTEGLTYYVRAYATNTYGTSYSSELTFVAGTAGALSYPSDAQTRVTSLIHRYDRGTYTLEVGLGEITADFGLPEWSAKPRPSLPSGERELISPLPGAIPSPPGVIPTLTDYIRWLASKTEAQILAIFGHPPSYSEWLAWIQRGG